MDSPIRLLLAGRSTLLRAALARLLAEQEFCRVVGQAGTRQQAIAAAIQRRPNILLLEPQPDSDLWLDAIGPLNSAAGPTARVLLMTSHMDTDVQRQAIRHGARGIVSLTQTPETLYRAIDLVHRGDVWLERRLIADLLTSSQAAAANGVSARIDSLTTREREVVRLLSEGLKNKEIAERLSVADATVRHHLTAIFAKLEVEDRLELVVFAFHNGLVRSTSRGINSPV